MNTATVDEIATLPDVDRSVAARIVAHRPYQTGAELVDRNVVDRATYDAIAPRVVLGPPAMPRHVEYVPPMPTSP